jgi:hypothetical protein
MMRFILVAITCVAVAVGIVAYAEYPDEFARYTAAAATAGLRAWEVVEANPVPVVLALGTFLLTVVYHKARGKTLRDSVAVAATRVAVVPVPRPLEDETPVVKRAKARATRAQLLADQFNLQNRHRKLPEEVRKAEKETCYTEQALTDAERVLANRRKAHDEAVARLEELREEKAAAEAELAEIDAELKKLEELV